MNLTSPSFGHMEDMPTAFTCEGEEVSPELNWDYAPEDTKSFALTCFDPDAPGNGFVHWRIYNIPGDVRSLKQGEKPPGIEIINDSGKTKYRGACPPSGKHRYLFTLYALFAEKLEDITEKNFDHMIEDHALATAELIGLYKKQS